MRVNSGKPTNKAKNTTSAASPAFRLTENGSSSPAGEPGGFSRIKPVMAEPVITAICPIAFGHSSAVQAANRAIVTRATSVQRLRAMPHTAWATTATATIFRPCNRPLGAPPPHAPRP
ncbi:hypothetical protein D3C81_1324730 [compost metagenome]